MNFVRRSVGRLRHAIAAEHGRDRYFWIVAFAISAVLLAIQVRSGAYSAEFTHAPDEPAHFVSTLLVYDFIRQLPTSNPSEWAAQYYLHYPFVGIGHWPPGYFGITALWWQLTGPTRAGALVLQWLTGSLSLILLYRLARQSLPAWISGVCVTAAGLTPAFHESLGHTMSDTQCVLIGLLFVQSLAACLAGVPGASRRTGFWFLAGALMKGTTAGLAPAPVIAWLAMPNRPPIRFRHALIGAGVLAGALTFYLLMGRMILNGGMNFIMPWKIDQVGELAGWGVLLLAAAGIRREPLPLAAASSVIGVALVSYIVRALRTDRHWLIVLPAIVLLAGFALSRIRPKWLAMIAVAGAAWTFPLRFERQPETRFTTLVQRLPRPSRMVISSASTAEGEWTAVTAAAEKRPGSVIMRGSQIFWRPRRWRLLTKDVPSVLLRLDETAADLVILHEPRSGWRNKLSHHKILSEAVRTSPAWKRCDAEDTVEVFCRVAPPAVPRVPLRLYSRAGEFEEKISSGE